LAASFSTDEVEEPVEPTCVRVLCDKSAFALTPGEDATCLELGHCSAQGGDADLKAPREIPLDGKLRARPPPARSQGLDQLLFDFTVQRQAAHRLRNSVRQRTRQPLPDTCESRRDELNARRERPTFRPGDRFRRFRAAFVFLPTPLSRTEKLRPVRRRLEANHSNDMVEYHDFGQTSEAYMS